MNKYDISIIVPVYNNEKYIDKCLNSILNQNFDLNRIQIILINDGSTDNSLSVMKKYRSDNILIIDKKNSGVSDTRNIGLQKSKGKYIMFLDSDDYISKDTCKNLFNLFEMHYDEIDLITYPIIYNKAGSLEKHPRYSQMFKKGTGIYDLTKNYSLVQATVNIFIKNKYDDNILFDVNQNFSEDERFATEIIMNKQKIGFCKEAIYYYRRHVGTANDTITNPFYSFETINSYYEYLFDKYKVDNHIPKYIQALYLNNLSWRIKQDVLFPYHLEKKEYDKAINRIKKLVKQLDIDVILDYDNMNFYHRMFLLDFVNYDIKTEFKDKIAYVYCNNKLIKSYSTVGGYISRLKLKNNRIYMMANLLNPMFYELKPEIYIEKTFNDKSVKIEKIDVFNTNNSYHLSNIKITNSYGFDIDFDINRLKKFKIFLKINDYKMDISFVFKRFTSNNFIKDNKNVLYNRKSNSFIIRNKNISTIIKSRIRNFKELFKNEKKLCIYRFLYYFYPVRNVWLYTDRGDALDNAYTQFMHDYKKDKIKRYYVSRFNKKEKANHFEGIKKKYLVRQGSLKHILLYLHSKKILTSFADLQVYCPLYKNINYFRDLTEYDLIYLQHGILHANLINMYSKEYTEIDKFVISSNFEKANLINKYHYKENDLLETGMPRITSRIRCIQKNKILFAPSWRKYLIGNLVDNKRELKVQQFINSSFYKEIYNFLHSNELKNYLIDNDLILDFKLHPIFKKYGHLFELDHLKNIKLSFDKTNIYEYKLFITDFSSFQFDFVKLKRPIIYFMPDIKEFKAGLHTYRELDLKYEDAFGTLCFTSDDLLKEMQKITKNNYGVDKKYLKKMENFFIDINNPTEDIYRLIR